MIVDVGLNNMFRGGMGYGWSDTFIFAGLTTAVSIGSGTAAPLATDTALGAEEYKDTINKSGANGSTCVIAMDSVGATVTTSSYTVPTAGLEGIAMSEIGLYCTSRNSAGASPVEALLARDLIRDSGGTPITVTPLLGDTITVTWEVTITRATEESGTVTIAGLLYNWRAERLKPSFGILYDIAIPSGYKANIFNKGVTSWEAYVTDSFESNTSVFFGVLDNNDQTTGIQTIDVCTLRAEDGDAYSTPRAHTRIHLELDSDPSKGWIRNPDQEVTVTNMFRYTLVGV